MANDRRFFLDRRVAFVDTIFRIIEGERAYDEAIDTLVAAERMHGLRIIHDAVGGSPALSLIPARKDARLTMREIIDLNSDTDRLWAYYHNASYEQAEDEDKRYLFPFISETQFLLGGTDFANDHLIEYTSGMLSSWTQRAWGAVLAEWANATGWLPELRSMQAWDGTFFCYYLHERIERYELWQETVLRVIQLKCARQIAAGE